MLEPCSICGKEWTQHRCGEGKGSNSSYKGGAKTGCSGSPGYCSSPGGHHGAWQGPHWFILPPTLIDPGSGTVVCIPKEMLEILLRSTSCPTSFDTAWTTWLLSVQPAYSRKCASVFYFVCFQCLSYTCKWLKWKLGLWYGV